MSDVEVTYKEPVTRAETARTLAALAEALADSGKVELTLGHTSMTVRVPGEVQCKVEVEIDGDEVEFEVELRWSTAKRQHPDFTRARSRASGEATPAGAAGSSSPSGGDSSSDGDASSASEGSQGSGDSQGSEGSEPGAGGTGEPAKRPAHRRKAGAR